MTSIRTLIRLACRLQQTWQAHAAKAAALRRRLDRLVEAYQAVYDARRALERAESRYFQLAGERLRSDLEGRLTTLRQLTVRAEGAFQEPPSQSPSLASWIDELRQLEAEFGALEVDLRHNYVAVCTEPLILEHVELGAFSIRLFWERRGDYPDTSCFEIVALDPRPATANDSVTHPHVRDEILCPGAAAEPVHRALEEGRLADAFCLVAGVLRHYNPRSPHVALSEWDGVSCYDCESSVAADSLSYCEGCQHHFCDECSYCCDTCSRPHCRNCLTTCEVCGNFACERCLRHVPSSGKACCRSCIETCSRCGQMVAADDRNASIGLCPQCQSPPPPAAPAPVPSADALAARAIASGAPTLLSPEEHADVPSLETVAVAS